MEIGGMGSSKKPNDKDNISSDLKEGLGLRGIRVLVVEDNSTNQLFTAYMLRKLDCIVDVASDGAEAVTMISKVPYQIVLMDCCMPEMDGFKATEIIRAQSGQGRTVPIIAVTASVTPGERERCLRVGMNDFLAKPFSPSMLIKTMARWTLPYR